MNDITPPIKIEVIQESIRSSKKHLINELGKLYDLRESKGSHLRFGCKSRTINHPSRFHSLREQIIHKGD